MQRLKKKRIEEKKMRTINQKKQEKKLRNKNELNRKHNCNIKCLELVALKAVIGRS